MNIENELAIRNLIARVAWLTDQWKDVSELQNEYTEDCIWHAEGIEPYRGHDGLARRMLEVKQAGICGPGLPMRHCITSLEVIADPKDENAAFAHSYVIMPITKGDESIIWGYGQMHDTLRRVDGRWRIAVRRGKQLAWRRD
jgi:hypothetical protein